MIQTAVIVFCGILLLGDIFFAKLYNISFSNFSDEIMVGIFIVFGLGFISLPLVILYFIKRWTKTIKGNLILLSYFGAIIFQIVISIFILIIFVQILTENQYSETISSYSQIIGLSGGIFMIIILLKQLILAYKTFRSYSILLFTVAFSITLLYFISISTLTYFTINNKPEVVSKILLNTHIYMPKDSIEYHINEVSSYLKNVSFLTLWIASGFLLKDQFKKNRMIMFPVVISIPIVYFIGIFLDIRYFVGSMYMGMLFFVTLIIFIRAVSPLIGGVIFGLSFFIAAKKIPKDNKIKIYLAITGYALMLSLATSQYDVLLKYPYPPFGTISIASIYFSSYLLLIGIYYTAVTYSQNVKIEKELTKILKEHSKLSHEMGTSLFMRYIEKEVDKINTSFESETGVNSELTYDEMKDMIDNVMRELNKTKKSSNT